MPRKPRVRANGEGTIYQNPNKTWTAQITTPNSRPSFTHTSQRKVLSWLTQQRRDLDTGNYVKSTDIILGAWWYIWIKTYKGAKNIQNKELPKKERFESTLVSRSSISSYDQSYKRTNGCCPTLLKMPVQEIRRSHIQDAINLLSQKYSDDTVRQTYIHLHDAFNFALEDNIILKNPCYNMTLPNTRKPDVGARAMNKKDIEAFTQFCLSPPRLTAKGIIDKRDQQRTVYKYAALTYLSTAIRRGELCSLMWSDVYDDSIRISKSLSDAGDITAPKNEQSIATIPVADDIMKLIKSLPRTGLYVFAGPRGRPISPSTMYHWMVSHTEQICSRRYSVHELRHTMITEAARKKINPKVLQTITRHKRLETLLKVYTHVDEQDRIDAINAINPIYCKSTANAEKNQANSENNKNPETLQSQGL